MENCAWWRYTIKVSYAVYTIHALSKGLMSVIVRTFKLHETHPGNLRLENSFTVLSSFSLGQKFTARSKFLVLSKCSFYMLSAAAWLKSTWKCFLCVMAVLKKTCVMKQLDVSINMLWLSSREMLLSLRVHIKLIHYFPEFYSGFNVRFQLHI